MTLGLGFLGKPSCLLSKFSRLLPGLTCRFVRQLTRFGVEFRDSMHHLLAFGLGEAHVFSGLTHVLTGLDLGLLPEFANLYPDLFALGDGEAHVFSGLTHVVAGLVPDLFALGFPELRAFGGLAGLLAGPRFVSGRRAFSRGGFFGSWFVDF